MKRTSAIIPVLLLAFAAACSDGPTVAWNSAVHVALEGNALRLSNLTDEARGFFAIDREFLSNVDLDALCNTVDAACLRLPAKGSLLVPLNDVLGYDSGSKTIVVYTWRVLPNGAGGFWADADDTINLKL